MPDTAIDPVPKQGKFRRALAEGPQRSHRAAPTSTGNAQILNAIASLCFLNFKDPYWEFEDLNGVQSPAPALSKHRRSCSSMEAKRDLMRLL
jgi:hypothetical protein